MHTEKAIKRTIFSLVLLATLTVTSQASAQGNADAALDDALQAAERAAGQSVLSSTVYAARVLGMPEQIQTAVIEVSKHLATGESADDDGESERPKSDRASSETSTTQTSSDSTDESSDSGIAGMDFGNETALDLGVSSSGRQGGDSVREESLDIARPEPRLRSSRNSRKRTPDLDLGHRAESAGVTRVVESHFSEVQSCYTERLAEKPKLSGTVSLKFMVDTDGNAIAPVIEESSLEDETVESCITDAVDGWQFPEPVSGQRTTWTFPFTFRSGS